jgi:hypothetical protein
MASLVYASIRAASDGWSDHLTLAAFAAAVVLLGLFLLIETRARRPITPLGLFTDAEFRRRVQHGERDAAGRGALRPAILVTVFGTASGNAAGHPLAGAAPLEQAHYVLTRGMARSFGVATIFDVCALLVILVTVRGRRA